MQVVILCGGRGTRIRDVSADLVPKPMISIGERPMLWHIMNRYAAFGHTEFILCLGHLSWTIKEYFLNYHAMERDLTVTLGESSRVTYHGSELRGSANWTITLCDTGGESGTAERVRRIERFLKGERFMLTYGDGLADVDFDALCSFHQSHGKGLTLTGVIPPGRFGELALQGSEVVDIEEKPAASGRYINGGFMVVERDFIGKYLSRIGAETMLEREPLVQAAHAGDMMMYKHDGFWQCMDTHRDFLLLSELWQSGNPPWCKGIKWTT